MREISPEFKKFIINEASRIFNHHKIDNKKIKYAHAPPGAYIFVEDEIVKESKTAEKISENIELKKRVETLEKEIAQIKNLKIKKLKRNYKAGRK
jgi:hypothetical protein